VVNRISRLKLLEKPQALLREREWNFDPRRTALDERNFVNLDAFFFQHVREQIEVFI